MKVKTASEKTNVYLKNEGNAKDGYRPIAETEYTKSAMEVAKKIEKALREAGNYPQENKLNDKGEVYQADMKMRIEQDSYTKDDKTYTHGVIRIAKGKDSILNIKTDAEQNVVMYALKVNGEWVKGRPQEADFDKLPAELKAFYDASKPFVKSFEANKDKGDMVPRDAFMAYVEFKKEVNAIEDRTPSGKKDYYATDIEKKEYEGNEFYTFSVRNHSDEVLSLNINKNGELTSAAYTKFVDGKPEINKRLTVDDHTVEASDKMSALINSAFGGETQEKQAEDKESDLEAEIPFA